MEFQQVMRLKDKLRLYCFHFSIGGSNLMVTGTPQRKELENTFAKIWQEVADMHNMWGQYQTLFVSNKETVDFLNDVASSFFAPLQSMFITYFILSIARLSDPAKTGRHTNLSIEYMTNLIEPALGKLVHSTIDPLAADFALKAQFVRAMRDKHIAHLDLASYQVPVGNFTYEQFRQVLASLVEVMNAIEMALTGSMTAFHHFHNRTGNAAYVLWLLRKASDDIVKPLDQ
jgi:hypothetical protein